LQDTEIKMRTGGKSGAANQADGLADFDVLADAGRMNALIFRKPKG